MTIDERLERLTSRHEALAESVQMLLATSQEHNRSLKQDSERIRALMTVVERDGEHIRALARVAGVQHERLTRLESGPG